MFIPLHVKSDYSLGYGTASIEELVERAATLGYSTLGLTDLENLYGQVRFHHACRARGIRPVTGIELRPHFDGKRDFGRRAGRVVLLASNRAGYRSLCRIVSRRRGAAGPRAGKSLLGTDPVPLLAGREEGLFVVSDDLHVLERLIAGGTFSHDRLGLLLVRPEYPGNERSQPEAARRLRIPLVADLDVVLLEKKDYPLHLLQIAVRQGRRVAEVGNSAAAEDGNRYLRTPAEVASLFADIPEAIANTQTIADACQLDLGRGLAELPNINLPPGLSADERLHRICEDALAKRVPPIESWTESHHIRLRQELATFTDLGLSGFILIVAEIVEYCQRKNIPLAARGSAVSSLALHLLGASPVDPVKHGLLFERFLHAGKYAWPDVDLDLPWHRRDEVIRWVYDYFGREHVAMVAAHHTFKRRSALREGLKAWGLGPTLTQRLNRTLPPDDLGIEEVDFLGLADAINEDDFTRGRIESIPGEKLGEVLPLVQRLIDRPHHVAAHPGGIVIDHRVLEELIPLERAPKGVVITQYDLTALAELGFVKIDLLGNRCLSEIEETLELAAGAGPRRIERVPAEDSSTLHLIDHAETIGCFQLESPAMRSLISRVPIRQQSDVVAALALIRPGAAAGEAKAVFVRRARDEEPDALLDPVMADRLEETHGLLIYEEDIMLLLSRLGGIDLGEADELRSAIVHSRGDPGILARLEVGFRNRATAHLGAGESSLARIRRAWAAAAQFAAYSFSKAHAVSYGQLAYVSAYMKTHHLLEFACALINHHQGLYPLRTLVGDLSRRGVVLRAPHVNASDYHSVLEGDRGTFTYLRIGLDKIKRLSLRAAYRLLRERAVRGLFSSMQALLQRVPLSRSEVAALVLSGTCDGLSPLFPEDYPFVHEALLGCLRKGCAPAELDQLRFEKHRAKPDQALQLYQGLVRVRNELRYLEMHLTASPMALLRAEAVRYGCVTIRQAEEAGKDSEIRLAVTLAAVRRVPTRQGIMQFLTLEDETGILEATLLPPAYRCLGERVTTPGPFLVEGKLRRPQGTVHVEVTGLSPFYERKQPFEKRKEFD